MFRNLIKNLTGKRLLTGSDSVTPAKFVQSKGKLFFLSNAIHIQNQSVSKPLASSMLPFWYKKIRVSGKGVFGGRHVSYKYEQTTVNSTDRFGLLKVLGKKLPLINAKRSLFNSGNYSKLNRFSNPGNSSNKNNLRNVTIFGFLFMGATFFITPYLFQYVPGFTYLQKNPSAMVWGIIGINAAVFALWQFPRHWYFLRRYFLLEKDAIFSKWSLVGSAFSHQELWHIGANMLCLYSFGFSLANMLGSAGFFSLYMNSLMFSSLFSLWYPRLMRMGMMMGPSLGASGALFGVVGAFSYLIPQAKIMLFFFPIPGGAWVAFLGSVAWNVAGCAFRWGTFDYAAHLGGSLIGVLYGYYFHEISKRRRSQEQRSKFTSLRDIF